METHEIIALLQNDANVGDYFRGVFSKDLAPKSVLAPCAIIINTEPISNPKGHWIAIWIDRDRIADFFDSGGNKAGFFHKFLKENSIKYTENTTRIQGGLTKTCGMYCVLFLKARCQGASMQKFVDQFSATDYVQNDIRVTDTLNSFFSLNYKPI